MIKLTRIVESYGAQGQLYDLGKDFSSFRRMIDGADQQIRQQFEQQISAKLVGKRVRAQASRGYKQYVKTYEFDVTRISLDDYYDNFVVVAYDSTSPKPKEYFLKPGFKVQILGPATGQKSPQKGGDPRFEKKSQTPAQAAQQQPHPQAQHQPMALAPAGQTAAVDEEKKQTESGLFDAYGVDDITQDLKGWLPTILEKPETAVRDFISGLGWKKDLGRGTVVAMYDLKLPSSMVKANVNQKTIEELLKKASKPPTRFEIVKLSPDEKKGEWTLRIKKVMSNE